MTMNRLALSKCMAIVTLLGMTVFMAGCTPEATEEYNKSAKGEKHEEHHDHGPHDGHVIEVGDDDYHAEMVFDEKSRDITIYMFGSDHDLKETSPIESKDVTLNLIVDEKPLSLKLVATPDEKDPKGKSSRFVIKGDQVDKSIHDEEDLIGKLSFTIGEKRLNGEIKHDHD